MPESLELRIGATIWRYYLESRGEIREMPLIVIGVVTAAGEHNCRVRWDGETSAQQWGRSQLERIAYPTREAALIGAMSALTAIQKQALSRANAAARALVAVRGQVPEGGVKE